MRRSIFSLIFIAFLFSAIFSQERFSITGVIIDTHLEQKLSQVSIYCEAIKQTIVSDIDGQFTINNIPAGNCVLIFKRIGYKTETRTILLYKNIDDLRIEMIESPIEGHPVVVSTIRYEKRSVPITFANIEKEELENRYTTQDIPILLSELPSTTFYSESGNGIGYNYLNIRGFDQRRISVMINGVPQNDPEDHNIYWLDFPDIAANLNDIQVQRGAGTAFYGPASVGGSINLVTSNFSDKRRISLLAGMGDYNTKKYSFSVNSGIISNKYAFYGRLSRISSDGYRDNSWSNMTSFFLGGIRYDNSLITQFHIYGGPITDHLAYYGMPKEYIFDKEKRKTNSIEREQETEYFSQPHYEILQEWKINNNLTFYHSLFFVEGEGYFIYDASWADSSYFRLTSDFGFAPTKNPENALIKANVHNKQYGWIPRLKYEHTDGTFSLGMEYRNHNSLHWGGIHWAENLPQGLFPDYRYYEYKGGKNMFSLFAHELYKLNDNINILLNLQYNYNKYKIYDEKFVFTSFDIPYHFFNPLVGINYNINENFNTYITLSNISREPRLKNIYDAGAERDGATPQFELNDNGNYDFTKPLVKPENLLDLELGLGYNCENVRSTINFYWMDFKNEIVKSGSLDRFGQPITGNAEKTRHIGVEYTLLFKLKKHLTVTGNISLSKNEIIRSKIYRSSGNEVILDGNRISGFPDILANLRISYVYDEFSASLLMQHSGDKYSDNYGDLANRPVIDNKVDPFTVFNFDASYNLKNIFNASNINFKFQINNLFNKLYATHAEGKEFFPAAERHMFFAIQLDI
jgi:iron complex outermembrane receptor protein